MIEKMKFLSITGPKADIDRVVNQYLAKYEIHLENAMVQLNQVQNLSPFIQINPYKEVLAKAEEFTGLLGEEKQLMASVYEEYRAKLIELSEPEYRDFNVSLMPGTDNVLGVRVPLVRKLAKELAKGNWREYFAQNEDIYFEETQLLIPNVLKLESRYHNF